MNTDKPDAVDLLPCPFCGSDKVKLCQWKDTRNPNGTWAECTNCGVMQDTFHHEDAEHVKRIAAMMWNTRTPDLTQLSAENDRLKKEVEAANDLQATLIKNACTDEYCKDEEDNNLAAEYGIPHDSTTCACPCHEMEDAISVALEGDSK